MEQNVVFVGAGNVAWHLAPALDNLGYAVRGVYSRDKKNAKALVRRLYHASILTSLDLTGVNARWVVVSVPDDAVEEVASEIAVAPGTIVTHTSGALPMGALSNSDSESLGVFYPLQTFGRTRALKWSEVPFLLEASTKEGAKTIEKAAKGLSKNVRFVDHDDRKAIHTAAVFACNFTNHMLTIAKDLLSERKGIDFELLKPLIVETINKGLELGPDQVQTGPAVRNDFTTIDMHYDFLDDSRYQEIYQLVTQSIIDRYA